MEKPRLSPKEYLFTIEDPDKPGQYKKGARTIAGFVAYNSKPREEGGPHTKIKLQLYINCLGHPMPIGLAPGSSSSHALFCPGAEWAYPDWLCDSEYNWHPSPDTLIDLRSLKMMKEGCCPISIITEQLGGEESQD
ncbi:hypothetical protein ES708_27629 [subsurface metagenome]